MIDLASGPQIFAVGATAVGALSGALFAVERRFGLSGVFCLTLSTGVSGSMMRDLLLQSGPSVILTDYIYLLTVLICATIGFFFSTVIRWVHPLLVVFDALSIGFFAVVGASKALHAGLGPLAAILVGTINAIGGWVLRDILAGDQPQLVQPGPVYAIAAGIASVLHVGLVAGAHVADALAAPVTIGAGFAIRMAALRFGWNAPVPIDLTPRIRRAKSPEKSR
ncbi:trimeric intracellular cation channel family protein [Burkholderia guangdongensis]|uniref:trimeric intracellular cation channel family protein n=1 Tax=Burkholderia guangdongensis TaxID=1792500 RepID=UPI0015C91279|nr:TRIC cation channel family protein [Burkholderia guangdongensis]